MTAHASARTIMIAALAALFVMIWKSPPWPAAQERPRAHERIRREDSAERGRELLRQDQQIKRARHVTRRVLHDRRASPEMKQQATELQALLDRRDAALARLVARHKDFMDHHRAEIDELEDLHRRARELDQRLSTARNDVLQASQSEIASLKLDSSRASELVEALRQAYAERRRERRPR